MREIEAGDPCIVVGIFEQMLGDLACAAADIEDVLKAGEVELAVFEQTLAKRLMQRDRAAHVQNRAFGPVVDITNLIAIFVVVDAVDQVVLDDAIEELAVLAVLAALSAISFLREHFRSVLRRVSSMHMRPTLQSAIA